MALWQRRPEEAGTMHLDGAPHYQNRNVVFDIHIYDISYQNEGVFYLCEYTLQTTFRDP